MHRPATGERLHPAAVTFGPVQPGFEEENPAILPRPGLFPEVEANQLKGSQESHSEQNVGRGLGDRAGRMR